MRTGKIITIYLFLFFSAGLQKEVIAKQTFAILNDHNSAKDEIDQDRPKNLKQLKSKSFAVSCGGGCAMTYTATAIKQSGSSFKVRFKVEMYVNQDLTDTYTENYSFIYDAANHVDQVLDVKHKNALETLPVGARKSFIDFGKDLIKTYGIGADSKVL